jgi:membrane fusion protein, heavy metal efflux system
MNGTSPVTLRWPSLIAGAFAFLAVGAGIAYFTMRPAPVITGVQGGPEGAARVTSSSPSPAPEATTTNGSVLEVAVTLTLEAIQRAGIVVAAVTSGSDTSTLRLPGVVAANAYKQVAVTPIVGGHVTRVLVELGQHVRRDQAMAEIFSPELAEAETRFVSARAELDAHERELQRTEKLVAIGSASRQELERLHAEHTAKLTAVESARSRLELLGLSGSAVANLGPGKDLGAVITVPAPIAGVVTERTANPGLNVDTAAKLFTVVELSTEWVVADLYEKDFSQVRVGTPASITLKAFPETALQGRVSYIDPQVNPDTRTAKVRVEVLNPRQELRLGMFADVSIDAAGNTSAARVPRAAVQNIADRTVVYLADPKQPGRFVEREVRLGSRVGNDVVVLSGVQPGDRVVTDGSFFVRAERERLGLRTGTPSRTGSADAITAPAAGDTSETQATKVLVTERGYEPAKLTLRGSRPLHGGTQAHPWQRCPSEEMAHAAPSARQVVHRGPRLDPADAANKLPEREQDISFGLCGRGDDAQLQDTDECPRHATPAVRGQRSSRQVAG